MDLTLMPIFSTKHAPLPNDSSFFALTPTTSACRSSFFSERDLNSSMAAFLRPILATIFLSLNEKSILLFKKYDKIEVQISTHSAMLRLVTLTDAHLGWIHDVRFD